MEKIITMENLSSFAYCNHNICTRPIIGITVMFNGLGSTNMHNDDTHPKARLLAEHGILLLHPYQNPWAWMNRQTVDLADELMDVLIQHFHLPETIPIVATGPSMGGLSALVYTAYAKHTPVACVANCPVCDLVYHFNERPDLPRTLYSAFGTYPGTMEEALRSASPLHLIDKMPASASYYIFHCEEDSKVNIRQHSDRFVERMAQDHSITYYTIPGMDHCALPAESLDRLNQCIIDSILSAQH